MALILSRRSGRITANNDYLIPCAAGSQVVIEIDGELSAAVVTLGRLTLGGDFIAYQLDGQDILLTAGSAHSVIVTGRGGIVLRVAGGGAPMDFKYLATPLIA